MRQVEVHNFLERFFRAAECEIVENTPTYLTVDLTIEMDKAIMNRPFYWHYVEKTGQKPQPARLSLITDFSGDGKQKGEKIHFGSPRLMQIFNRAREMGAFVRLYEIPEGQNGRNTPLYPWLNLNMKISYLCDRKKDMFRSIGLHLINGMMIDHFHGELLKQNIPLSAKIPDYSFTISPLIKPGSGIRRIKERIRQEIIHDDHTWAHEAQQRWQEDVRLLERFYEDREELPENYHKEKKALKIQYEPRIEVKVINGGLLYLTEERFLPISANNSGAAH